ncbi:MAG: hypothetical protein N2257_06870 [Thermodesulfovibrionales bacterium]|nr:hypothetical protein [Thermodesulfovibrionales bacterium]
MATYKEIQEWVKQQYGYTPKTCWIAHINEICGLNPRRAPNRQGERKNPCPPEKIQYIKKAFEHFN